MAGRPPRQSLDFAGWSVDIFDNEPKIDKLIDAQGCVGFTIFFFLCQRAYGSNGYFYEWSFDDAATTARKIGGGACSQAVAETVRLCLRVGLFDKGLHDKYKILTSRGIQKRYMQVALTRTNKSVIKEYWLLKKEESAGLNFHTENLDLSAGNANYDPSKSNYQPLKESKVKESIVKDSKADYPPKGGEEAKEKPAPILTLTLNDKTEHPVYSEQIKEWSELYPAVDVMQELRSMKGWCNGNPKKRKTKSGINRFINGWLSREQNKGGRQAAGGQRTKNIYAELSEKARAAENERLVIIDDID